ncbi:hypothetical protein DBR40_23035 [Pedobacter sp. KBW01]|uniref:DUF4476 domain-containing protein n=1 Tax=Pedobacter sp. KBW01 TaxID=2153364 RepID=UPI000F5ADB4E|nr:DUF4476 domain-containing protein [Pedobacter sp. KBW01]RQO65654.1 hypothetical protein DBR40_23035 [Pedobacter sp. KBW01]
MKKTILLGLVMLFATLSFAQNNRSAAEVFLQITKPGKYMVYLDDELVGSATGRFRFYDVYNSKPELSIMQGDRLILKEPINVNAQERLVLGFDNGKLNVIKQLSLFRNNQYALDDFYGYSGDPKGDISLRPDRGQVRNYNLMSPEAFQQYFSLYKKERFDDGRSRLIKATSKNATFITEQVKYLLKEFSFDDQRLETAKHLYSKTLDKQNYTLLAETFRFSSSKDDFLNFIAKE